MQKAENLADNPYLPFPACAIEFIDGKMTKHPILEEVIPSVKQGYMLKEISDSDVGLTPEKIAEIMIDEKDFNRRVVINNSQLKR